MKDVFRPGTRALPLIVPDLTLDNGQRGIGQRAIFLTNWIEVLSVIVNLRRGTLLPTVRITMRAEWTGPGTWT